MLLRVTEGRGNFIEYVIAGSAATWQSQPFHMRLLRPFRARNDMRRIFLAFQNDSLLYEIAALCPQ